MPRRALLRKSLNLPRMEYDRAMSAA